MSGMNETILRTATVGLLILGAISLGCAERVAHAEPAEPIELQTYKVPPDYQEEIKMMLRSALESDANRVGRVTAGPAGTILVVAPARIQSGVRAILDDLKGLETPPLPPAPVKLSYWFLVGRPMDPSRGPFAFRGVSAPMKIEPALQKIVDAQGPTEFALVEQLELTSLDRAQIGGSSFRVDQRTSRAGDKVVAELSIGLLQGGNRFQSQVMLEPNQVVVLAQSGFDGKARAVFPDLANETVVTLYYVMVADSE